MKRDYLIRKWLSEDLTNAEESAFSELDDYQLNLDILEYAKYFKASNFSSIDNFEAFKQKYDATNVPVKTLNWYKPLLRIASVIVIALSLYFTIFYNNLTQVQTLASEKTTIELPDHSKVMLNALSEITFSKKNWDDYREIKLNGEAYFKVTKGNKFDVVTKQGTVTVVGTEFNVKQRENFFEVKCFEGIVKVVSNTIERELHAGDIYRIINEKFAEDNTTQLKPHWAENKSNFKAIPFGEVIAELERQYNIKVVLKDNNINRLFTGGFTHNNLENALISITQPMNMTYELNTTNLVVIHGNKK